MMFKVGCLFITLLIGSIAFPLNEEDDLSFFFKQPITDPFIIGGTIEPDPVPYMVALTIGLMSKSLFCGGSIVNERFVLSAAHCIRGLANGSTLLSSLRGTMGSNRWSTSRIDYVFSHGMNHPDYINNIMKNDIGFLVTASAITFTDNVQPVVLNFDFIGANVATFTHGWGSNVNGGPESQILMKLCPFTVDGQQCITDMTRRAEELNKRVPPVHPEVEICTYLKKNRGICHGDSGSALMLEENNQQIGVVSWVLPCAQGAPDIYVRISAFRSWILERTGMTKNFTIDN